VLFKKDKIFSLQKRTKASGFMNVILSHSYHRHVSANHVGDLG